ncbi:hypothetical protein VTK56DRAFT_2909 [Thermocarpiscus australiensis]
MHSRIGGERGVADRGIKLPTVTSSGVILASQSRATARQLAVTVSACPKQEPANWRRGRPYNSGSSLQTASAGHSYEHCNGFSQVPRRGRYFNRDRASPVMPPFMQCPVCPERAQQSEAISHMSVRLRINSRYIRYCPPPFALLTAVASCASQSQRVSARRMAMSMNLP